jgi:hypothetical protein
LRSEPVYDFVDCAVATGGDNHIEPLGGALGCKLFRITRSSCFRQSVGTLESFEAIHYIAQSLATARPGDRIKDDSQSSPFRDRDDSRTPLTGINTLFPLI